MHYLTEDNRILLKRKPASDLSHFINFHLFKVQNDITINDSPHNLFFVLSQKILIVQTRLNVLLGDINKLILIKTTLQQLKLVWLCYQHFFIWALQALYAFFLLCFPYTLKPSLWHRNMSRTINKNVRYRRW